MYGKPCLALKQWSDVQRGVKKRVASRASGGRVELGIGFPRTATCIARTDAGRTEVDVVGQIGLRAFEHNI